MNLYHRRPYKIRFKNAILKQEVEVHSTRLGIESAWKKEDKKSHVNVTFSWILCSWLHVWYEIVKHIELMVECVHTLREVGAKREMII